jgi:hypothetical protein
LSFVYRDICRDIPRRGVPLGRPVAISDIVAIINRSGQGKSGRAKAAPLRFRVFRIVRPIQGIMNDVIPETS